jgi:hypothetical protein
MQPIGRNMEDDDIEYDITFPSPNTGVDEGDEMLNDYVIEGESVEPVIIFIGWAGCKPKHLAKYCKIYEKRYAGLSGLVHLDCSLLIAVDLVCSSPQKLIIRDA